MARVLIGLDGSDIARQAAARALAILGGGHQVTMAEIVRPPLPLAAMASDGIAPAMTATVTLTDEESESLERDAEEDARRTARDLGVDATVRVVMGDPSTELCRLAEAGGVDLLVVGSHGSGLLKRVLLGSVSSHLLHHAPCPVMVVRCPGEDDRMDAGAEA